MERGRSGIDSPGCISNHLFLIIVILFIVSILAIAVAVLVIFFGEETTRVFATFHSLLVTKMDTRQGKTVVLISRQTKHNGKLYIIIRVCLQTFQNTT